VTFLLDANVLIALVVEDHVHHTAAETWYAETAAAIATCPITQGSLVRLLIREGQSAQSATAVVSALMTQPRHVFWPDDAAFDAVSLTGVIGHRQVTDAYLATSPGPTMAVWPPLTRAWRNCTPTSPISCRCSREPNGLNAHYTVDALASEFARLCSRSRHLVMA
jgi:toxin-antitoxin system PIN domain toxin